MKGAKLQKSIENIGPDALLPTVKLVLLCNVRISSKGEKLFNYYF